MSQVGAQEVVLALQGKVDLRLNRGEELVNHKGRPEKIAVLGKSGLKTVPTQSSLGHIYKKG